MITRIFSVLVAASLVYSQYIPLSSIGDDNDCALYLSGPGRSSAYDYNLNLLRGSFPYDGQHTCITYDAVNQAYIDARKRINVAAPKGDWKPEDVASVGELMLDISINLARTYGLTYEEIEKGLPLIDTSKTLIREVCPPFLSHVECRAGKYRRFDGLCTNLKHPTWGAANAPFQRLIAPLYSDGINAPRISVTGNDLPLSRVVSRTMHPDEGFHDHAGTVMVIAWGQFMDHDYTLTGTPLDPLNRNDPEECCNRPPHLKHPYCNEIPIPDDDYFYRLFNVKCIDFVRAFPSPRAGCRLGSRQQFNTLTGVLDGNTVYGVNEKFSRKLRSGVGGMLRMNPVFAEYGLKDLLPLKLDFPDEGCTRPNNSMYCFEAGEIRVNEQLVLTCMHTLMAREHNRVAKGLAEVNPHWDDETLFQEARRIVIAEIQHITYNEFLPILLGKEVMEKFGLLLNKEGYWDGYDENINPSVIDAFAAAAFRFGHSLLPTAVERWSKAHKFIASKRLSDLIRRPFDLYRAGIFDEYLMGLMNQVAQAMDDSITQEVTNHLFKKPGKRFGMDLVSFNMQRGREFGVPGYMEFRKFCGLPAADSFQELFGSMPNETIQKYESIFEHPSDVDLWSGGVSERPLPGSMLGPTFACVIATQFSYSRRGDRFWFELPNQPSSFTPEQLQEVRKARLARVMCDNTDIIDTVQLYPMVLPDHEINPRVPCRSGIIPMMDFTKWADYGGHVNYNANPYGTNTEATFDIPKIQNTTTTDTANSSLLNEKSVEHQNATRKEFDNLILGEEILVEQPNITKTDSKSSTLVQKKSSGHYKNSLRRKKRDITLQAKPIDNLPNTTSTSTKPRKNKRTQKKLLKDSQAAAIVVRHVSGKPKATTEGTPPSDQRQNKAPNTFIAKPAEFDISINHGNGPLFDKFNFNKVGDSNENENKNKESEDEGENDNDEEFVPDNESEEEDDDENEENEEDTTDSSLDQRNNNSEESTDNEKLDREQHLGHDELSKDDSDISNLSNDYSRDPNQETIECSRGTKPGDSSDDSEHSSKSGKGICKTSDGRLETVDDNIENTEETEEEQEPNEEQLSENVKEQFEYIPLDYKHDDSSNDKSEDIQKEKDSKPYIELGDTTIDIDDIKLPDISFKVFDDEYFEKLKKEHNKEYRDEHGDDDDDEYGDDDDGDDDENEDTENNDEKKDAEERNEQESEDKSNEEDIDDDSEENDNNDENDDDKDDDNGKYYSLSLKKPKNKRGKTIKEDDEFKFNPGYAAFDISDVKDNIKDYSKGLKYVEEYIQDPQLKDAVGKAVDKSKQIEQGSGTDDDPKYNYYWTLEYGQPL